MKAAVHKRLISAEHLPRWPSLLISKHSKYILNINMNLQASKVQISHGKKNRNRSKLTDKRKCTRATPLVTRTQPPLWRNKTLNQSQSVIPLRITVDTLSEWFFPRRKAMLSASKQHEFQGPRGGHCPNVLPSPDTIHLRAERSEFRSDWKLNKYGIGLDYNKYVYMYMYILGLFGTINYIDLMRIVRIV